MEARQGTMWSAFVGDDDVDRSWVFRALLSEQLVVDVFSESAVAPSIGRAV
jgi:hypothetical protein